MPPLSVQPDGGEVEHLIPEYVVLVQVVISLENAATGQTTNLRSSRIYGSWPNRLDAFEAALELHGRQPDLELTVLPLRPKIKLVEEKP